MPVHRLRHLDDGSSRLKFDLVRWAMDSMWSPSRVAASAIGSGFSLTNERGLLSSGAGGCCCWFAVADDEPLITF